MAKRVKKDLVLPQIVEEGGILYTRSIYSIQKRLCQLVHTIDVRYDKILENTSWSILDPNDEKELTTLLYTHEKHVDTNPI